MNSFTFLLVCAQAFFIQTAFGQCIPCGNAPVYPIPAPACSAPSPYYPAPSPYYPASAPYHHAHAPGHLWGGSHGISVAGDNLVIDGQALISGAIPFVSSVQLDGDVPADGAASLRNACCCGDRYL